MPKFLIVVDDTITTIRCKVIEAESFEDAKDAASFEDWTMWQELDSFLQSIIREDLCEIQCKACGGMRRMDQSCGCFDNGSQ